MPNWEPNWSDVKWDHAIAAETARKLDQLADSLDQLVVDRQRLAQDAQNGWQGRKRDEFDQKLAALQQQSKNVASGYRAKASLIRHQSIQAAAEQMRRNLSRLRWTAEVEAEKLLNRLNDPNQNG